MKSNYYGCKDKYFLAFAPSLVIRKNRNGESENQEYYNLQ